MVNGKKPLELVEVVDVEAEVVQDDSVSGEVLLDDGFEETDSVPEEAQRPDQG